MSEKQEEPKVTVSFDVNPNDALLLTTLYTLLTTNGDDFEDHIPLVYHFPWLLDEVRTRTGVWVEIAEQQKIDVAEFVREILKIPGSDMRR